MFLFDLISGKRSRTRNFFLKAIVMEAEGETTTSLIEKIMFELRERKISVSDCFSDFLVLKQYRMHCGTRDLGISILNRERILIASFVLMRCRENESIFCIDLNIRLKNS